MKLSERERRFVDAYVGKAQGNASKAAEIAGYSAKSARRIGTRLSTRVHVREAIAAKQDRLSEKAGVTAERVIQELALIAFSDIRGLFDDNGDLKPVHELPEEVARALASVEVTRQKTRRDDDETTEEWIHKVKTWDKPRALELLVKTLGMLKEKIEHEGAVTISWER